MIFLQEKIKKFGVFYFFFVLLIAVGFILSGDGNFTPSGNPVNFLIIGIFVPLLISFLLSIIYEAVADGTFHKMRILFIMEGVIVPLLFFSIDKHIAGPAGIILSVIFITTQILAVASTIWTFRKSPVQMLFYLSGLFLWFYLLVFYYRFAISDSLC